APNGRSKPLPPAVNGIAAHGQRDCRQWSLSVAASGQFQTAVDSRSIPTRRQASSLLTDPALQIFKGSGMHCVYNQSTALCARDNDGPSLGECRRGCSNIARTDEDIEDLTVFVADLTADVLAPPIRYQRGQQVAEAVTRSIQQHERSRTDD
ncbi:hypothetical protein, partial [Arthrobacter sp. AQ5-05]|uniref:hypothetical protein n=1 Tax=Arthrobacter sp. AQ5-05 TaxID=2184581 RepID=UPI001C65E099